MSFLYLIFADVLIALPTVSYYYYWGIVAPEKGKHEEKHILKHLKRAYILTAATILIIPSLLLWYLYSTLLHLYFRIFIHSVIIIGVLIAVLEYINYYNFENYEKKRIASK